MGHWRFGTVYWIRGGNLTGAWRGFTFISTFVMGSLTFGGGYSMISALQQDLVARHVWLTPREFSNSQITPGPLMMIGYKMAGFWGTLLGTLGLFYLLLFWYYFYYGIING